MYIKQALSAGLFAIAILNSSCYRSDLQQSEKKNHAFFFLAEDFEVNGDRAHIARGVWVFPDFFFAQNCKPLLGRVFRDADIQTRKKNLVILNFRIWYRLYGEDKKVIGRKISLNDSSYDIVGVMPPSFDNPPGTDIWLLFPKKENLIAYDGEFRPTRE